MTDDTAPDGVALVHVAEEVARAAETLATAARFTLGGPPSAPSSKARARSPCSGVGHTATAASTQS